MYCLNVLASTSSMFHETDLFWIWIMPTFLVGWAILECFCKIVVELIVKCCDILGLKWTLHHKPRIQMQTSQWHCYDLSPYFLQRNILARLKLLSKLHHSKDTLWKSKRVLNHILRTLKYFHWIFHCPFKSWVLLKFEDSKSVKSIIQKLIISDYRFICIYKCASCHSGSFQNKSYLKTFKNKNKLYKK